MESKILFVCPYPFDKAASQRFRFEQYLVFLNGEFKQASFWTSDQWPAIYGEMSLVSRIIATAIAFLNRFFLLLSIPKYDKIFIHREATPIGPPWFEWCVAKIFRKHIIFDFDDAIWLPNSSQANAKLVGSLKNHDKTAKIISWSKIVFAGNEFLATYARRFCDDVRIVPTTIDTKKLHNPVLFQDSDRSIPAPRTPPAPEGVPPRPEAISNADKRHDLHPEINQSPSIEGQTPTIGWTGTHSTLKQLIPLFPVLEEIHSDYPFRFLLIADQCPQYLPLFVEFRKWNKKTEIKDLLEIDIGIMPLYDTDWEKGKCGFKALQYLALGIPAVVSDVGVNTEIVRDGQEGFIAEAMPPTTSLKWKNSVLQLLKNETLCAEMGEKGRKRVVEKYSVEAWKDEYVSVFNDLRL